VTCGDVRDLGCELKNTTRRFSILSASGIRRRSAGCRAASSPRRRRTSVACCRWC